MTDSDTEKEDRTPSESIDRRSVLALLAVPGFASLGSSLSPETEQKQSQFGYPNSPPSKIRPPANQQNDDDNDETPINMQDAGADPTGEEPIDDVLRILADDETHLYFPEGQYRLGEFSGDFQNLVLEGEGARILPKDRTTLWRLVDLWGEGNVIDGFVFDYRDTQLPPEVSIGGPGGWAFRNCTFLGTQKTNLERRGGFALLPTVASESGEGVIENVYMHEGSAPPSGGDTRGGIWFGPGNEGTLRIDGVWMEGWAENTIYAHNSPGEVVIENSFFRNTNVAGTRIGGNTVLRNNTYVKTGPVPRQTHPERSGRLMRGVWITGGRTEYGSAGSILIEDCDFYFTNGNTTGSAIIQPQSIDGDLAIRDCRIYQETDWAIRLNAQETVSFENVHISGETENEAIFLHPDATVDTISGSVDTSGPVSNRSDISDRLTAEPATPPNTSPPDELIKPDTAAPIPNGPD